MLRLEVNRPRWVAAMPTHMIGKLLHQGRQRRQRIARRFPGEEFLSQGSAGVCPGAQGAASYRKDVTKPGFITPRIPSRESPSSSEGQFGFFRQTLGLTVIHKMLNTFAIHHDSLIAKTAILTPYFLYGGINPRFDRSHCQPRAKRDGYIKPCDHVTL